MNWKIEDVQNPAIKKQIEEQLKGTKQPKKSKYSNEKTQIGEHKFDSLKEANRFSELQLLIMANEIADLRLQVRFPVSETIYYVADFVYFDFKQKKYVVEDVKGVLTDVYKIKRKLFREKYGFEIYET